MHGIYFFSLNAFLFFSFASCVTTFFASFFFCSLFFRQVSALDSSSSLFFYFLFALLLFYFNGLLSVMFFNDFDLDFDFLFDLFSLFFLFFFAFGFGLSLSRVIVDRWVFSLDLERDYFLVNKTGEVFSSLLFVFCLLFYFLMWGLFFLFFYRLSLLDLDLDLDLFYFSLSSRLKSLRLSTLIWWVLFLGDLLLFIFYFLKAESLSYLGRSLTDYYLSSLGFLGCVLIMSNYNK